MAGFGAIPIRDQFSSMGELADLIMKKRVEQEKTRQFNEQNKLAQAEEGRKQQKFPLELQEMKGREQRLQQMFPHQLQHAQDMHSTSIMNNMINKKAMERAEAALPFVLQQYRDNHRGVVSAQKLADVKNAVYQHSYQTELDKMNQMQEQQNAIPENDPGAFLSQGMPPENMQQQPGGQQMPPESAPQQMPNQPVDQSTPMMGAQAPNMPPSTAPEQQPGSAGIGKEVTITPGNPTLSYKNIEGKPSQSIKNGFLITTYPDQKVTAIKLPAEMAGTQRGTALEDKMKLEEYKQKLKGTEFEKKISAEDAKNLSTLNKSLYAARDIQPNLDYMHSLANSPEMKTIKQNPLLFGKDITYFQKSKEHLPEQKVIGKMIAVQKNMYAEMAQKFKGAFRKGEQELFDRLLPSDSDTIDVMMGKIQGMETLNRSVIQRLSMVDDLVRNRENKMTINHAMEQADKKYPISKLEKEVEEEYGANEIISVRDNKTGDIKKMTRAEFNKLAEEHNE